MALNAESCESQRALKMSLTRRTAPGLSIYGNMHKKPFISWTYSIWYSHKTAGFDWFNKITAILGVRRSEFYPPVRKQGPHFSVRKIPIGWSASPQNTRGRFAQIVIYYNFIIEFITDPAYICDPVLLLSFVAPAWNGVTLVQSVGLRWLACVILSLTLLSRLPTLDTHGESIAYNGRTPGRAVTVL